MKSIAKRNSIGLVGGVISLTGLCIGIYTLGKKSAPVTRRASRTPRFAQPIAASYGVDERREWKNSPIPELGPVEVCAASAEDGNSLAEIAGRREQALAVGRVPESSMPETLVASETKPAASAPEFRTPGDTIAELCKKGESNLEIARALGVSLGEVQLTIQLRGLSARGAAAAGKKNGRGW